jgi:thymidylate synthase (FAD)
MKTVEPNVRLLSSPTLDVGALSEYLDEVGGGVWLDRVEPLIDSGELSNSEGLVEFAGRLCYRSWAPGLNPNVTKVREHSEAYLKNIVSSLHGSVTEHAYYVFLFDNVSRVFTHELVRHRVGTSISQESLRYVRLEELSMWMPEWAYQDKELHDKAVEMVESMEQFQIWMADHFDLNSSLDFTFKKHMTSFMRRFAPEGLATTLVWGANIRTLRHVIELRTSLGAEEELRLVFDKIATMMKAQAPIVFDDFEKNDDGEWKPQYRKI